MALLRKKHPTKGSRTKAVNSKRGLSEFEEREKNKKRFLEAFVKNRGLIYQTLESLGMKYQFYRENLKSDPDFAEAVYEAKERNLDRAEQKILEHIDDGEVSANMFYLRCQGKHRGYVERQELRVGGDTEVPLVDSSLVGNLVSKLLEADQKKLNDDQ